MGVLSLFRPTQRYLTDTDVKVIERAIRHVSTKEYFSKLYLTPGTYVHDGFKTEEKRMGAVIQEFLKSDFGYIVYNSQKWLQAVPKSTTSAKILDSLLHFSTILDRIKNESYMLRHIMIKGNDKIYSEAICYDTDDNTREHYLKLLKDLSNLR